MNPFERVVKHLSRLPGIGEKSATRLALFLLRDSKGVARDLAESLSALQQKVRFCKECQNLTEEDLCPICRDENRDRGAVCVVQEPVDLMMIEKTGEYRGVYHILHGSLSPLDGIGPEQLRIPSLLARVKSGKVSEVILATNPTPEGEATALYLKKLLAPLKVKTTRIASGIPVGGTLEYTDAQTLTRAMGNRRAF